MGAAKQDEAAAAEADRRTVPERIADAIDYDIAAQRFAIGERLIETQLAERFGVGRGSVRDALRLLAQRGSVQLNPKRGAMVCGYSLDTLADVFAVAGMLIALGARYVAHHRQVAAIDTIRERTGRIEQMVAAGFAEPLDFATALGGFTAAIVVGSGNTYVRSQLSAVLNRSVWRAMWEHPCDHLTPSRQREELASMQRTLRLIEAGDGNGAERELRAFHQKHCEAVLAELARQRGERAPASPPLAMAPPAPEEGDRLARIESRLDEIAGALAETRPALGRWKEKA
jgi:DNA-binding GntR family transcriptional regulator